MHIRKTNILLLLVLAVGLSANGRAQQWSGILDPTRAVDWSAVGVGGIPARNAICATLSPNGPADMTAAINAALRACPSGQAVALTEGTFAIRGSIEVPSNVTLRGAGADRTVLNALGSGRTVVVLGQGSPQLPGVAVTSGANAGSTSLVVAKSFDIAAGKYLLITELNDPAYVSIHGGEGDCRWCDEYDGARARGQIVEVTSVDGRTIGIAPALYSTFGNAPLAAVISATKYAGVENLQVYANNTGYTASFAMNACAYCWIKGVEANYTDGDYVQIFYGYRDEVRDSYFSNAYSHAPGRTDADIFLARKTSASLVENNIIERSHASVMLNWGAAGNVIAYNYSHGAFSSSAPYFTVGSFVTHGAHPQFNLWEGNVGPVFDPDETWGSSSHNTLFRNWAQGTTLVCNPLAGRGKVNCSPIGVQGKGANGWWAMQASAGIIISHLQRYYNLVGNVVGSASQNGLLSYGVSGYKMPSAAVLQWPAPRSFDARTYNFEFGYGGISDAGPGTGCDGSTNPPCHDTTPFTTAFFHGNFTNADRNITWARGMSNLLPASFYLPGRPTWWAPHVDFPAIGPDVAGGTGPGGHCSLTASNPAQNCYLGAMGGSEGGAGSPLPFNAERCYGTARAPENRQAVLP
jgi:hypothetical protein